MLQHVTAADHIVQIEIERGPDNPFHEEHRKLEPADEYSLGLVVEAGQKRQRMSLDMLLNGLVSLIPISQIAAKAANGEVACGASGFKLVDVGELPGGHERHSQT